MKVLVKEPERIDGRSVQTGSLVAARWQSSKDYAVGIVSEDPGSLFNEEHLKRATHVVLLKKASEVTAIVNKAKKAFWESVVQDFPEGESRPYAPYSTIDFDDACRRALHNWLNLQYSLSLSN
ncbi:MAG: hypothetical protein J7J88_01665 [Dehalococcoidia bacterium]|nr:hypothetical protein [Dehalococcoidia bacterium]